MAQFLKGSADGAIRDLVSLTLYPSARELENIELTSCTYE